MSNSLDPDSDDLVLRTAAKFTHNGDPWVAGIVADKVVSYLQENNSREFDIWLRGHARYTVLKLLDDTDRDDRRRHRPFLKHARMAQAIEDFEDTGDPGVFEQVFVVNKDHERKEVGDMTGDDHRFVAAKYGQRGREQLMYEAFHLAVAKKVKSKRTREVMTEDQYTALLVSISQRKVA